MRKPREDTTVHLFAFQPRLLNQFSD